MATRIHLLGDSTLDNVYWLLNAQGTNREEAERNSVAGQLRVRGFEVLDHAYDGFTTRSVLEGDYIGSVLPDCGAFNSYL